MSFTSSLDEIVAENANKLLGSRPHWKRVRLREVCTILNGYPFESSRFSKEHGTPLLRIRDILPGTTETFYEGKFDTAFIVKPGELVIGMDGDFNCDLWRGEPALLNQRVCKITADETRYSRRFLYHVLPGYLRAINAQTHSVTVKHLSSRTVGDIPLPCPPIDEQAHIVAELETQLTRLDAGVTALKRVQANLKRYCASVRKAACEGRLVPTEAELARCEARTYESGTQLLTRLLSQRSMTWAGRKRYKEPNIPSTGLDVVPEGWTLATVEQLIVAPLCNGISVKGSDSPPGIRALRLSAMSDHGFDYSDIRYLPLSEADVDDLWIQEGDFFISRGNGSLHLVGRGTSAQAYAEPTIFPDTMIRLRLAPPIRASGWLSTIWSARLVRSQIEKKVKTTAGIYKIAQPEVEGIVVPLPPLAEQQRIVAEVERRLSVIEKLETSDTVNLKRANRFRESILSAAFGQSEALSSS